MTQRQQVIINRDLRILFAEKCLKERLIESRANVKKVMEMLMQMYLDGIFDKMLPNNPLPKRHLTGDETRVQLNKKLKGDFSFRVWQKTDLINDPSFGVRALELLMKMYVDGKIKIKRDE